MRNFITNPARVIVRAAVVAARQDQSTFNAKATGNVNPTGGTAMGTRVDGTVYTIHAMMWDLDNWDDEEALWV